MIPKSRIHALKVYEPGRPLEEVARELGLKRVAELDKLASNENVLGPSPRALRAMQDALGRMHLYPDGGGYYLKQALSEKHGLDVDRFILGNGSNEIIEFLGHVFLEPGTNMVMSQCAFLIYKLVASSFGSETIEVPMQHFTHDLSAMRDAITMETRLVFIANPNNPTGTAVSPEELQAFLRDVPEHVLVVLDEAYVELMPEALKPDAVGPVRDGKNVLVLRTFSKAYGLAGLRVGYGMARPEIIQWLEKFRQPFNVNAMALAAARAALADDQHVARFRKLVEDGLAFWEQACTEAGWEFVPATANVLLVKTGRGREVFNALQQKGVIVRPMDAYGLPDFIRITLGTESQNKRCLNCLKQIISGL